MNDKRMTGLPGNVSVRDGVRACIGARLGRPRQKRQPADTSCRAASLSALRVSVEAGSTIRVAQISSYGLSTGEVRIWLPSPAMTFTGTVAPVFM
jgi:hypothetical protein